MVCKHLAEDRDFATLAAIVQTGWLGYDVAGSELYRELTVDDNFHFLLTGLEHSSERKERLLRNVRHVTVGPVWNHEAILQSNVRLRTTLDVHSTKPLFPERAQCAHLVCYLFYDDGHPVLDLLRGCRPTEVCVSYPSYCTFEAS